jgi:hypothetical protein
MASPQEWTSGTRAAFDYDRLLLGCIAPRLHPVLTRELHRRLVRQFSMESTSAGDGDDLTELLYLPPSSAGPCDAAIASIASIVVADADGDGGNQSNSHSNRSRLVQQRQQQLDQEQQQWELLEHALEQWTIDRGQMRFRVARVHEERRWEALSVDELAREMRLVRIIVGAYDRLGLPVATFFAPAAAGAAGESIVSVVELTPADYTKLSPRDAATQLDSWRMAAQARDSVRLVSFGCLL